RNITYKYAFSCSNKWDHLSPTTPITVSNISDPNLKFFLESTQQHSLSFKSSLRIDTMYYFNQGT
ncbi:hypothetical protein, partial [Acinetobacter bereziniae]|uniref:hypothetical protein n=1 Tax=Acinetobacter bereziniae TaxID=106648 RepID=UPI001BB2E4F1